MLELFLALFLSFVPALFYAGIVYWMDRYEKEPKALLFGVFCWGAIIAVIGAIVSQLILSAGTLAITRSQTTTQFLGGSVYAPLTEETLKGIGVLLVFLIFRSEFDSILDGIVYAGITAIGFAAVENLLYLAGAGFEKGLGGLFTLFFLRVIMSAWDHPMYTAFTGIGLAVARLNNNLLIKFLAPAIGWSLAVGFHAVHNGLILGLRGIGICLAFPIDWLGWLFIFGVMVWAIRREQDWLVKYLREEVTLGTLNAAQYRTATSSFGRTGAWLNAIGRGRVGATRQFYKLCAELAFKKAQFEQLGDENGNRARIAQLRERAARLAPMIG